MAVTAEWVSAIATVAAAVASAVAAWQSAASARQSAAEAEASRKQADSERKRIAIERLLLAAEQVVVDSRRAKELAAKVAAKGSIAAQLAGQSGGSRRALIAKHTDEQVHEAGTLSQGALNVLRADRASFEDYSLEVIEEKRVEIMRESLPLAAIIIDLADRLAEVQRSIDQAVVANDRDIP